MANNNDPREEPAEISADEPRFMLRASDPQAADLVRLWAEGRDFLHGSADPRIATARHTADAMSNWCVRQGRTPVPALKLLPFELLAAELRNRGATVTPCPYDGDISEAEEPDS